MRLPSPPFTRLPLWGCGLLALLTACGTTAGPGGAAVPSLGSANGNLTATRVAGTVISPPQAGQAVFGAGQGQAGAVALAEVGADGSFELSLPVTFPPSQGRPLPTVPTGLWSNVTRSSCTGQPQKSDAGAALYVLNQGSFRVGQAEVGELVPMQQVLAGQAVPEDRAELSRVSLYVYAERPVTMTGTVHCTLQRTDAQEQAARIDLSYTFTQGWNMVQFYTSQPYDGSLAVTEAKTVPLAPLVWRFFPSR